MAAAPFVLPIWFELTAIFLLAMTGVWAASRRGYDIVGAFVLALVTGAGGGLIRDRCFIDRVPVVMSDARYLWAVLLAILAAVAMRRAAERIEPLYDYVDALAIGIYGVVGTNLALLAGFAPLPALIIGVVNAVGGGLLRDVLVREEPLLFKPGQLYVLAVAAGCIVFVGVSREWGLDTDRAAWIAVACTMALRLLAIRFNWKTGELGRLLGW
jgi:uncharacterized membrane protein YeiH